jgi:hypothetical protein
VIARAIAVWLVVLLLAVLNGAAREAWLIPRYGDLLGRALSTVTLSALAFLTTWLTIGWMHPKTFVAVLLEDYDLSRGRIWT